MCNVLIYLENVTVLNQIAGIQLGKCGNFYSRSLLKFQ